MAEGAQLRQHDQASGLRQLFSARTARSVAFFCSRTASGSHRIVARCAAALARGEQVLAIDECGGAEGLVAAFGLAPRYDLAQALGGHLYLSQAMLQAGDRLTLLKATRAARACCNSDGDRAMQAAWASFLPALRRGVDCLLVAAAMPPANSAALSPLAMTAEQWVVVTGAGGAAITDSYALIKRLAVLRPDCAVQVVVTHADDAEAFPVFEKLRQVAQRHLGKELTFLGNVPFDGHARRSVLSPTGGEGMEGESPAARACARIATALMAPERSEETENAAGVMPVARSPRRGGLRIAAGARR